MKNIRDILVVILLCLTEINLDLHARDEGAVDTLIRNLSDDSWDVREKATAELIKVGKEALPKLEIALRSDDPEVVSRARRIVERIRVDSIEGGKVVEGLQACLKSDKVKYKSGEPILLTLAVKNVSKETRSITPISGLDEMIDIPEYSYSSSHTSSHGCLSVKFLGEMGERKVSGVIG